MSSIGPCCNEVIVFIMGVCDFYNKWKLIPWGTYVYMYMYGGVPAFSTGIDVREQWIRRVSLTVTTHTHQGNLWSYP